jgi:hypothetical protein
MGLILEPDVEMVLQFMEKNVDSRRLVRVATAVSSLATIMWSNICTLELTRTATLRSECSHEQLSIATQSDPERASAGDGSVAEMDTLQRR